MERGENMPAYGAVHHKMMPWPWDDRGRTAVAIPALIRWELDRANEMYREAMRQPAQTYTRSQ